MQIAPIDGIQLQYQAITASMAAIHRRTQEHLGTSDRMVIQTQRRVIAAAKRLAETGGIPASVENPELFMVRSGGIILPPDADWLEATADLRRANVDDIYEEQVRGCLPKRYPDFLLSGAPA